MKGLKRISQSTKTKQKNEYGKKVFFYMEERIFKNLILKMPNSDIRADD